FMIASIFMTTSLFGAAGGDEEPPVGGKALVQMVERNDFPRTLAGIDALVAFQSVFYGLGNSDYLQEKGLAAKKDLFVAQREKLTADQMAPFAANPEGLFTFVKSLVEAATTSGTPALGGGSGGGTTLSGVSPTSAAGSTTTSQRPTFMTGPMKDFSPKPSILYCGKSPAVTVSHPYSSSMVTLFAMSGLPCEKMHQILPEEFCKEIGPSPRVSFAVTYFYVPDKKEDLLSRGHYVLHEEKDRAAAEKIDTEPQKSGITTPYDCWYCTDNTPLKQGRFIAQTHSGESVDKLVASPSTSGILGKVVEFTGKVLYQTVNKTHVGIQLILSSPEDLKGMVSALTGLTFSATDDYFAVMDVLREKHGITDTPFLDLPQKFPNMTLSKVAQDFPKQGTSPEIAAFWEKLTRI
ncbi:hypothetical protein OAN22_01550, partial [Alphaproteobacteria bacterium]|nr:hypothetical protein [Alphaproteobacteria bacterium]